ncbi:MAG: hypothetical protein ABSG82_01365 [Sedimentisphaerales bacterium]|jgi:hypothetical protein
MKSIWLKEVLFAGQTANGFKSGTVLTLGWFWVRINGCRMVYRGMSVETVNFDGALAVMEPDAKEIVLPAWLSYEAGQTYFYVLRCANRCGQIEQTLGASVKVVIDGEGGLRTGRPNSVFGLTAVQQRNGKVEIVWHYCPIEQESDPREMRVYCDEGTGEIDYQNPVATAAYKGRRFYEVTRERPEDGRYLFAVRVADANGDERESMRRVAVEIQVKSAEAIEIVGGK